MSDMVDLFWHKHPLSYTLCQITDCQGCDENTMYHLEVRNYKCVECSMEWHHSCVPTTDEKIEHPCHQNHLHKLLLQGPPNYSDGKCSLCRRKLSNFVFQCTMCDFSVDMICANKSPLVRVHSTKCHEHPLTLMARDVSFTCNACGKHGERNPYVCLPCSLMFHYDCIDLPNVININRHEHRVSHSNLLRPGNWVCEICRQAINWRYGAYSCNQCPEFFVHSRCATRKDVWDGTELKDIPEEVLDTAPFKVIAQGVISHFSHTQHNLLLIEDVTKDGVRCEACARPISSEKHYNCMDCNYILHEECANLPLKRRHGLSTGILSLSFHQNLWCVVCNRFGNGFGYTDGEAVVLDVRCASLSCFRQHKLHLHTLFLTTLDHGTCVSCDENKSYVLGCVECEYSLDFRCATLPLLIKHKCDAHFLVLRSGEQATGKYWCEICESETNPEKWFYTCDYCGVVCHIDCVVGDSLNLKPGILGMARKYKLEAVLNDHNSRPKCYSCGSRCRFPMFYKASKDDVESYLCSLNCFFTHF